MVLLHVEDSDDDVIFFNRALEKLGSTARVLRVCDGAEAQAYLRGDGVYSDRETFPFPDAIVLDLRMAGLDGRSFSTWLRLHPEYHELPCFVLADCESLGSYPPTIDGASGIYAKPYDLNDWPGRVDELIRSIGRTTQP